MWPIPDLVVLDLVAPLGKLTLAALVGGAIGFEREAHGQFAGLRTNILICVGACLLMLLSLHMEMLFRHLSGETSVVSLDPARLASYAIASMGFLGAGAIIKGETTVRGLTTAAGLWLVTAIGLGIGAGFIVLSLFTALISLVCLYGMQKVKTWFRQDTFTILFLKYQGLKDHTQLVNDILSEYGLINTFTSFKRDLPANISAYRMHLVGKENIPLSLLVDKIMATPGLVELEWSEG